MTQLWFAAVLVPPTLADHENERGGQHNDDRCAGARARLINPREAAAPRGSILLVRKCRTISTCSILVRLASLE